MAQRYGGKYSPDGSSQDTPKPGAFRNATVDPAGARANLMFLPPLVLAVTTFGAGATTMALGLVGAAFLTLGAWLLRDGLRAEAEYNSRKVARRPALPRKIVAADLAGIGAGLGAYSHDPNLMAALIYGVAVMALHFAAFGIDPLKNKGMEGVDTFQQDRVAKVVDEAEKHLAAMRDAVKRASDRQVEARVERFQAQVKDLIRTVEEDPRDLAAARRYLGVYLMGARDATAKFADIYARPHRACARNTPSRIDPFVCCTCRSIPGVRRWGSASIDARTR